MRSLIPKSLALGAALLVAPARPTPQAQSQDRLPSFSCSAGAVAVAVDRAPALTFESVAAPTGLDTPREFTFPTGPTRELRIYLTATLPESTVGRASEATLSVYAQTAASKQDMDTGHARWWQLTRHASPGPSSDPPTSELLLFDAKTIAGCFNGSGSQDDCKFATVALAANDSAVALITLGFTRDLGGANASNSDEATLLLDFREATPHVLATADCGYNEGGGVCTAIDSGEMPRSDFSCEWAPAAQDLLCTETMGPADYQPAAHRDFYLMTDSPVPDRPGELPTLDDGVRALESKTIGDAVIVKGLAPLTVVADVKGPDGSTARLFYSAGTFHLVPANAPASSRRAKEPRVLLPSTPDSTALPGVRPIDASDKRTWTKESGPRFLVRTIQQRAGLTVLEVAAIPNEKSDEPASDLYWVGVEHASDAWHLDVLRLAGGSTYEQCGNALVPPTVTSIGTPRTPFRVNLVVRPTVLESTVKDDQPVSWLDTPGPNGTCLRRANVSWNGGRFEIASGTSPCRADEEPPRVSLTHEGRLVVKKSANLR